MNWPQLLSSERTGSEKNPTSSSRSSFEQDYDRIIFSHPFRRLQDKTQVFTLPDDDFVHNRLTHSLEVSSVARSLGKMVGETIAQKSMVNLDHHEFGAIAAAASLAHDIGNPPFGHAGEDAISSFFKFNELGKTFGEFMEQGEFSDLTNFEGNAQGFRILNSPMYGGLKLTHATLAAFTKYPRTSFAPSDPNRRSQKKYGFNRSDLGVYGKVAGSCGIDELGPEQWIRHPLAFIVEAADDICYHIIDLEDGTRLGLVPFETTKELLSIIIGSKFSPQKLERISDLNEKLGILRAMAVGSLLNACMERFLDSEVQILSGEFDVSLVDDIEHTAVMKEIIGLSIEKIYRSHQVLEREAAGYRVIEKLLEDFCGAVYRILFVQEDVRPRDKSLFRLLPESTRNQLKQEQITVYQTLQIVIDFISGLTDSHAFKLYRTLTGISDY